MTYLINILEEKTGEKVQKIIKVWELPTDEATLQHKDPDKILYIDSNNKKLIFKLDNFVFDDSTASTYFKVFSQAKQLTKDELKNFITGISSKDESIYSMTKLAFLS